MAEIGRRLALVLSLLSGLWLVVWTAPELLRVQPVDWEDERVRKIDRAADAKRLMGKLTGKEMVQDLELAPEARGELEGFVRHQTEGFLLPVRGAEWEGFFNAVAATRLGKPPSPAWRARLGRSFFSDILFFRPDEPPLAAIAGEFQKPGTIRYLRVDGAARSETLRVIRISRQDAWRNAPLSLALPRLHAGLWCLLGGLLLYVFLPWPQRPREGLYYSRIRAGILPDLMAVLLAGFFFLVPIVVPLDFSGDSPFDPGWRWMTIACWSLTLLGLSICGIAAFYMARRMELTPEGFIYTTLGRSTTRLFTEIERVDTYVWHSPKAVTWALWIISLWNWRALGPALLSRRTEPGIQIHLKSGESCSLILNTLKGAVPFIGRLRQAGVPIAPEVFEYLEIVPEDPLLQLGFPPVPRRPVAAAAVFLIFLMPLAYGLWVSSPPPNPALQPGPLMADPFALRPREKPKVDWAGLAREKEILKQMAQEQRQMNALLQKARNASAGEQKGLLQESEKSMARVDELRREFEAIHAGKAESGVKR